MDYHINCYFSGCILVKSFSASSFLYKLDFGLMALMTFVMGFMNLCNEMGLTLAILYKKNFKKRHYASL